MPSSTPASESPSVLVTRRLPDNVRARLARDYAADFNEDDGVLSREGLLERARNADALLICPTEKMTAEVIAALPERVKMVACFSVGVDHVDLAAAEKRGLIVTNTPDVLSDATAEIAILLMLGAARRAGEGERLVRADRWNTWSPTFHLGTEITGKRLGLVGMGRNRPDHGAARARLRHGDPLSQPAPARSGPCRRCRSITRAWKRCCRSATCVSLHCPLTAETSGPHQCRTAGAAAGRGDRRQHRARRRRRRRGADRRPQIRQAGRGRPRRLQQRAGHPSRATGSWRTSFLLPHLGSATVETRDAMGFRALDNLDAFFAGKRAARPGGLIFLAFNRHAG